jgi:hypothetical protein
LTGLSNTDRKTLGLLIKAAKLMDEIFYLQVLTIAKQCECTCARSRLIHTYNLQKLLVYRCLPCGRLEYQYTCACPIK